jgi:hypothetical protein
VRPKGVILPLPVVQNLLSMFQRQEPVNGQTFISEFTIKRLHIGIISRFSRSGEVQHDLIVVRPPIHFLADKLTAIVTLNPLRDYLFIMHHLLKGLADIHALQRGSGHQTQAFFTIIIDYSQNPEPSSIEQGINEKIHAPDVMDSLSLRACQSMGPASTSAWSFAAQIQLFFDINSVHSLMIIRKTLPAKQHINAPETVSDPCGCDLTHAHTQQLVPLVLVSVIKHRSGQHHTPTGSAYRSPVVVDHPQCQLLSNGRFHSFFFNTSWSICLSRLRSATNCLSWRFSSSNWRSFRSSLVPRPPNFFFQLKNVAWEIPNFRQISSTWVPVSACLSAKAICASVNFDFFTVFRICGSNFPPKITRKTLLYNDSILWGEVRKT